MRLPVNQKQIPPLRYGMTNKRTKGRTNKKTKGAGEVDWWHELSCDADAAAAADGGDAVAGAGDASASGRADPTDVLVPGRGRAQGDRVDAGRLQPIYR